MPNGPYLENEDGEWVELDEEGEEESSDPDDTFSENGETDENLDENQDDPLHDEVNKRAGHIAVQYGEGALVWGGYSEVPSYLEGHEYYLPNVVMRREPSPDSNTNIKTTPSKPQKSQEISDKVQTKETQAQDGGKKLKRKMVSPPPANDYPSSDDEDTSNELAHNIKHIEEVKRMRKESESVAESNTKLAVKKAGNKVTEENAGMKETEKNAGQSKSDKASKSKKEIKAGKKLQSADSTQQVSMVPTVAASKEAVNTEGDDIDVQTMLNDFSDKLNENLLPDPFNGSDSDE